MSQSLLVTVVCVALLLLSLSSLNNNVAVQAKKLKYSGMTITNDKYCPNITYDSPVANDSIYHLSTVGTNYVSVIVTNYQMTYNSTDIFAIYDAPITCGQHACITATPEALTTIIDLIHHTYHMAVMLKPQIDLLNDSAHWRGQIGAGFNNDPVLWDAWFASYQQYIVFYAELAQALSVELLSVSTELIVATTCEYCAQQWRSVIVPAIRQVFTHGELTVSANWADPATNEGELTHIQWWDLMDYIGCDEYYVKEMSGNGIGAGHAYPSVDQLRALWLPIEQQMQRLSATWNKSVIFTEIGYCSGVIAGANDTCWCNGQQRNRPSLPTNQSLYAQYNQYQAAFTAMAKYDWFLGFFWWNWPTDAAFNGAQNSCMTPSYKPTELLLRQEYEAVEDQPPPPAYAARCQCWE